MHFWASLCCGYVTSKSLFDVSLHLSVYSENLFEGCSRSVDANAICSFFGKMRWCFFSKTLWMGEWLKEIVDRQCLYISQTSNKSILRLRCRNRLVCCPWLDKFHLQKSLICSRGYHMSFMATILPLNHRTIILASAIGPLGYQSLEIYFKNQSQKTLPEVVVQT